MNKWQKGIGIVVMLSLFILIMGCVEKPPVTPPVIPTCIENWTCTAWGACQPDGTQTRTCTDKNKCGTIENKSATTQNCTYVPPTPPVKMCEELEEGVEECIIERAYNANNIADCKNLNGTYYVRCIKKLAEKKWEHCYQFNETNETDQCIADVASFHTEDVCLKILNKTISANCTLSFVAEKCRELPKDERYTCDAIEKNNESRCLKTDNADRCYLNFSQTKRDVCDKISNAALKLACQGIITGQDSICETGATQSAKDYCYQTIATETANCYLCDLINQTTPYKDDCYNDCALKANDSSVCRKISEEFGRDPCYSNLAINTGAIDVCDKIVLDMLRGGCIETVALNEAEPSYCERLDKRANWAACYSNVRSLKIDQLTVEKCLRMQASYERDLCVNAVVENTGDKTGCVSIDDEALKSICEAS